MIARLSIALVIITVGCGAYVVGTRLQTRHVRETGASILDSLQPGIPGIIYFWSDDCAPCRLVQKPALESLEKEFGPQGIQIIAINALEETDVADEWGVLSLPTTFLIDRAGEPRKINHGVARAEQLGQQIRALES